MGRRLAQEVVEVVVGMDWTTGSCSFFPSGREAPVSSVMRRRVVFPCWSCVIPWCALAFEAVSCPSLGDPPGRTADPAVSVTCPVLVCGGPGFLLYLGAHQSCRCPGSQTPFFILGILWISITIQPLPWDHSRPHAPLERSTVLPLPSSLLHLSTSRSDARGGTPPRAGEWALV